MALRRTEIRHVAVALATLAGLAIVLAEPAMPHNETAAGEVIHQSTQRLRDRAAERGFDVPPVIWV